MSVHVSASAVLCYVRSLVFIWDSEALQLHGVFRVDSTAPLLPSSEVPGNRPHQVGRNADIVLGLLVQLLGGSLTYVLALS